MKIALVDNLKVGGGLSRFTYMLVKSMLAYKEDLYIDYYTHEANLTMTPELKNLPSRVTIKVLETTRDRPPLSFLQSTKRKFARKFKIGNDIYIDTITEIENRIKGYDMAYFPVAHMMKKPNLDIPIVGTLHDFNWKYFFGTQIFSQAFVKEMDREIVNWLTTTITVCASHDIVREAKKLYPQVRETTEVIHFAPLVFSGDPDEATSQKVLADMKIDFPYIIFPGNFFPHKNHLMLFTAFNLLKKQAKYTDLKLILTGVNSDQVPFAIAESRGVQMLTANSGNTHFDIMGLGYLPNNVTEILIKKSLLLVSPSIYEGMCAPGMDAWFFGTPTAISNIPPFKEHEKAWGIKTAYFDPMDVKNIAEVIDNCLTNYEESKRNAAISRENLSKYTWDMVAAKYLDVFSAAINKQQPSAKHN